MSLLAAGVLYTAQRRLVDGKEVASRAAARDALNEFIATAKELVGLSNVRATDSASATLSSTGNRTGGGGAADNDNESRQPVVEADPDAKTVNYSLLKSQLLLITRSALPAISIESFGSMVFVLLFALRAWLNVRRARADGILVETVVSTATALSLAQQGGSSDRPLGGRHGGRFGVGDAFRTSVNPPSSSATGSVVLWHSLSVAILQYLGASVWSAVIDSLIEHVRQWLISRYRSVLTKYFHRRLFHSLAFFRAAQLSPDENLGTALTVYCGEFAEHWAELPFYFVLPLFEMVATVGYFHAMYGKTRTGFVVAVAIASLVLIRRLSPRFGLIHAQRLAAEASFREAHQFFRDRNEPLALTNGFEYQRRHANWLFGKVENTLNRFAAATGLLELLRKLVGFAVWDVLALVLCLLGVIRGEAPQKAIKELQVQRSLIKSFHSACEALVTNVREASHLSEFAEKLSDLCQLCDASDAAEKAVAGCRAVVDVDGLDGDASVLVKIDVCAIVTPAQVMLVGRFGDSRKATEGVRPLCIRAGQGIIVIGPNGSGKSSLFRLLTGVWPARPPQATVLAASNHQHDADSRATTASAAVPAPFYFAEEVSGLPSEPLIKVSRDVEIFMLPQAGLLIPGATLYEQLLFPDCSLVNDADAVSTADTVAAGLRRSFSLAPSFMALSTKDKDIDEETQRSTPRTPSALDAQQVLWSLEQACAIGILDLLLNRHSDATCTSSTPAAATSQSPLPEGVAFHGDSGGSTESHGSSTTMMMIRSPSGVLPEELSAASREDYQTALPALLNIRYPWDSLSGGQQQKLALARLFFHIHRAVFQRGHRVLALLDESTSQIDARSEHRIYKNITAVCLPTTVATSASDSSSSSWSGMGPPHPSPPPASLSPRDGEVGSSNGPHRVLFAPGASARDDGKSGDRHHQHISAVTVVTISHNWRRLARFHTTVLAFDGAEHVDVRDVSDGAEWTHQEQE